MPVRAPRICSCGKVVPSGAACACQVARKRARDKAQDQKRGTSGQRGYSGAWDKARKEFLTRHRWCRRCGAPANVVDHTIPHRGDQAIFWDKTQWQPLCTPCHSGAKQRQERRLYGKDKP